MRTFNKKLALLILLISFAQNASAIEHEYSEQHLTDCEHSICIKPILLDDSLHSATSIELSKAEFKILVSIALSQQLTIQSFPLAKPPRAPPL